jgi:hypothetical protein
MTASRINRVLRTICTAPTRSSRLVAIAGALCVAPLVLGTGTATADTVNWDAIAQCESGGNWSTNSGNGHYGGLQFKQTTWAEHGGLGNPATAPRTEQIRVAERVLASQGLQAWPKCGPRGGAPAGWANAPATAPNTGCGAIRGGSVLGIVDLRRLCSSLLSPLTSLGTPH